MKKLFLASVICTLVCLGCSSSLNSGIPKGTAQWEMATFIQNLNTGKYEDALTQFSVNPVENGDISLDEFKSFMMERVTKSCTVSGIEMTETPEEFDSNVVRVDVNFTYKDGSTSTLWVDVEQVDNAWKITTRGSMF